MTSSGIAKRQPPYRKARGALTFGPTGRQGVKRKRFWNQVNNNLVALISLVLAITSLGYNTWRNETTEVQRNWRDASFQILAEIGELNQIILMRRYFSPTEPARTPSSQGANPIPQPESWVRGWGSVTMVRDISTVLPDPLPVKGKQLFDQWQQHAAALHDRSDPEAREEAVDTLLESIEQLRITVVQLISELR